MQAMISFVSFLFSELPDFLLSEPICYFVGVYITLFVIVCIKKLAERG